MAPRHPTSPALILLAALGLGGCEDPPGTSAAPSDQAQAQAEMQASQFTPDDLESGSYELRIAHGQVGLVANQAYRVAILQDLARTLGFELDYSAEIDHPVRIEYPPGDVSALLARLLQGLDYQVAYLAQANSDGFRIAHLRLGAADRIAEHDSPQSNGDPVLMEPPTAGIYLGDDPQARELAARLEFGSLDEQLEAISELNLNPAGLTAAYQIYASTHSPRVRIAVLELLEAESSYLAKTMLARSLQANDPAEAIYALSVVESQEDFSLAPQVKALYHHYDAGVRQRALEVLEALTPTDADADSSTPAYTAPRSLDPDSQRGDHR
jgi:hypothetical protein